MLSSVPYFAKKLLLTAAVAVLYTAASAQYTEIKGRVIDSKAKDSSEYAVAYANVHLKGTLDGTTTDADGYFNFKTIARADSIIVTYIGYPRLAFAIQKGKVNDFKIDMAGKGVELKLVTVKAKRHAVRDTVAEYVYHQVVNHKEQNKEESFTNYKFNEYQKLQIGIVNPRAWFLNMHIFRPFHFVLENRDTTADSTVFIPAVLKEDLTDVYYRKSPKALRRVLQGSKFTGVDNASLGDLLDFAFDKVNIYDEIYIIAAKSFVSPFAHGARFSTYEYFLRDTAKLDGRTSYKLFFVGRSNVDLALKGYAWIDSATWAVKSIDFKPNEHANLNYLKDYHVKQGFVFVNNNVWILNNEDVQTVGALFKNSKKNKMAILVKKHMVRKNIEVNVPMDDSLFSGAEKFLSVVDATYKSRDWWDSMRLVPLARTERELIHIHDTLKTVPAYKRILWTINLFSTANFRTGPIEFGRFYKIASLNNVEGIRLRLGVTTNNKFSRFMRFSGYGAYGLKDKDFKYNVSGQFMIPVSNNKWSQLEINYQYDMNVLGQQNQLLTFDNVITLLGGRVFTKIMKIREWNASLENEWIKGFTSIISIGHKTYYDIPGIFDFQIRKTDGTIGHLPTFSTFEMGIDSRYTYREKFYQTGLDRVFIVSKHPVLTFGAKLGFLEINGKKSNYGKFAVGVRQRVPWTLGHTIYQLSFNKTVGITPYPISYVTPGGFGILFNDFDFNLLQEFEFVTDQSITWYFEHHFEGYIFNKIPYISRLQLREILYMRGMWGTYSQKNYNAILPGFDFKSPFPYPYIEAGFGFENILKIIRLDSIWRLTYRDQKVVPNWAIKIGFNIVF